ncbi:MAG: alpha-L-rhamnosidase C-terminal domain-containing protein [Terracidiphilus sp.]
MIRNVFQAHARAFVTFLLTSLLAVSAHPQSPSPANPLDPARDPTSLHRPQHAPLAEQYIWTDNDAAALRPDHAKFTYRDHDRKTEPHAFRGWFTLSRVPAEATLYIAGPRSVKAWLNGTLVLDAAADPQSPLGTHVFRAGLHSAMRIGRNLLAIQAVRGRGIVAASDSPIVQQLAYGETLVAKIVPGPPEVTAPPLAITNAAWRSTVATPQGWQSPDFDDRAWPLVQSLGPIESSPDFFQWNTDAGMYDWPGYIGMSPYLRTYTVFPAAVTHLSGDLLHADALLHPTPHEEFTAQFSDVSSPNPNVPSLLLDFGHEVAGRLLIQSACNCQAQVLISYGESEGEALSGSNYLGVNLLRVPPNGLARGPKSGFRYAWIRFVAGSLQTAFRSVRAEGIAYPVKYLGAFESSDPLLNRIWLTAAYTAHLCMQDGVWDAPKRDRGRWAGDLDVTAPVISDVFGDSFLLDDTLARLIPPAGHHVNGIPGYTALWITTLANLYRHNGDKAALERKHDALLRLLAQMDAELDASRGFTNKDHRWLFVDWAPGLFAYTDNAVEGTELEFVRGYRQGDWLLDQLGDHSAAERYNSRADSLAALARARFSTSDDAFGATWQLNAMAILSGVARPSDYSAIWDHVLHGVNQPDQEQTITPYFNFYLLEAMARMGHRQEALDWLRSYWGGMIAEGATSFWEAYDLRWPKQNPHLSLQADGTTGYFVSLAHGWSSGPAAWLMEEILGVKATEPGFRTVQVRPDLAGLQWVRGAVPTPLGSIRVSASSARVAITIPAGMSVTVLLPAGRWTRNNTPVQSEPAENGSRVSITLHTAGRFEFVRQ